jgi:protocatechuate 3,4-dioxygenase beta subunit
LAAVPEDGAEFDVRLERAITIRGRCVNRDGDPVADARVTLRLATLPGDPTYARAGSGESLTATGKDGGFSFDGVPDARATLMVSSGSGVPVEVIVPRADDERVADVGDVRIAINSTISGRVVDDQGAPVPGALVRLWHPRWRDSGRSVQADADGRFSLRDLGDGAHSVRACEPPAGEAVEPMVGSVDDVPAGSQDVEVRLLSGRMVEVTVRIDADPEIAATTYVQVVIAPGDEEPADDGGAAWHRNPGVVRRRVETAGDHIVIVRARGFSPFRGTMEVSGERMVHVSVTLAPEPVR